MRSFSASMVGERLPHIMETPNAVELAASFSTSGEAGRIYELNPEFKSMGIKKFETIEGNPADGLVIIKFDDRKDFENWYYSKRYQEYLHFRIEGADAQVFLIEGFQ